MGTNTNTRDVTIQNQRFQLECTGSGKNMEIHIRSQGGSATQGQLTPAVRDWTITMNKRSSQHQANFRESGGDYTITVNDVPQAEYGQYLDQLENYLSTDRAAGATATHTGGTGGTPSSSNAGSQRSP